MHNPSFLDFILFLLSNPFMWAILFICALLIWMMFIQMDLFWPTKVFKRKKK